MFYLCHLCFEATVQNAHAGSLYIYGATILTNFEDVQQQKVKSTLQAEKQHQWAVLLVCRKSRMVLFAQKRTTH